MNWIADMNRCTGPAPCQCSITGPHQPTNPHCSRNRASVHKSESFTPLNGAGEPAATHFVNAGGEAEFLPRVTEAEIDAEIRRSGCLRTDENRAVVRRQLEAGEHWRKDEALGASAEGPAR